MEPQEIEGQNAATLWCAGLPMVAERSLTDAERGQLERSLRRSRKIAVVALVTPWALLAIGIPLSIALAGTEHGNTIGAATALGFVFALIFSVLIGSDHNKVVRGLRLDLETGRVEQYQGVMEPAPIDTLNFQRLRKEGVETGMPLALSFEVLKGSGFLLSVGERRCTKWASLTRNQVAAPPMDHYEERLAPAPRMSNLPAGTELASRSLTAEETDEIKRYIGNLFRTKWVGAVGFTLWATLPVLFTGKPPSSAPTWYLLCAVALMTDYLYARDVLLAFKLKRDLELPVTVVDVAAVAHQEPGQPTRVEILGCSNMQWRADGKPAQWRRLG